ncbi:MAG: hypothetical protein WBF21_15365 [Steroidobacteraceae bacterium]
MLTFSGVRIWATPIAVSMLLAACGGGSDSPGPSLQPTASLSAAPLTIATGGASLLTWSSTDATACSASGGWSGAKPTSGSQSTGALAASTAYSLTCTGAGGASKVVTAAVTVMPAATAMLAAKPTAVESGATATLTWSSTNATSCTASGTWSGDKPTSGSQSTAALASAASYSLVCSGAGGSSKPATASVAIIPAAAVTLTASPTVVAGGAASTLTWSSANATSCTASGGWSGVLPTSGAQSTGALNLPSAYSLTCTGPGGSSAASSVLVNIVPATTLSVYPTVVPSGGTSELKWSSTNASACTATGGWSGTLAASGTQSTGVLLATNSYYLSCTGAGGTSNVGIGTVTIANGTVTVAPKIAAITVWQPQQFAATVPGGGAATWTVDGIAGGSAGVGTISTAGLYTPGTAVGTHAIVATSVANSSESGSAVVAVTALAGVYTYHDDLARDGVDSQEYALTTASVNTGGFGKLFSCGVDGAVYAQPLWVANLTVNGAQHNVVFVATEHDSLFAFDADAGPCTSLWTISLIDANHGGFTGETTVPAGPTGNLVGAGYGDITPEVGVTGTPVIDPAMNVLYVVSKSVNSAQTTFYQRLHAIDLATGSEKPGSPATIAGTYPGTGDGGTTVTFNPRQQNQRSGLVLLNGAVCIAWSAHEDARPYYGWVMSYTYNGTSFTQGSVLNVTPNAQGGGIWMDGGAMAADSMNNLYVLTGNGAFDATNPASPNNDLGDSMLQLSGSLSISQYFTPSDQLSDEQNDADFGSGGAAVLADLPAGSPVTHLVVGGGKDGNLYVLNRDLLGGLGDTAAVQKVALGHGLFSTGAFWNNSLYVAGAGGALSAYSLSLSQAQFTLSSASSTVYGWPGGTPSVSSSGVQGGIVWILDNHLYCTKQSSGCGPTVLHAYDATNMASELWNSTMVSSDAAGNAVKFTVPTVANGRVYVGTRGNNTGGVYGSTSVSGELEVYGLQPN